MSPVLCPTPAERRGLDTYERTAISRSGTHSPIRSLARSLAGQKYDRVYSGLQYWLTVIEHVQVVAEMIALRFGDR